MQNSSYFSSASSESDCSLVTSPSHTSSWFSLHDAGSPDTSGMMSFELHQETPRSPLEPPPVCSSPGSAPFEGINTDILPQRVYVDEAAFYSDTFLLSQIEDCGGEEAARPLAKTLEQRAANSRKRQQQITDYHQTILREDRRRRWQIRALTRISRQPEVTEKKLVHKKKVRFKDK